MTLGPLRTEWHWENKYTKMCHESCMWIADVVIAVFVQFSYALEMCYTYSNFRSRALEFIWLRKNDDAYRILLGISQFAVVLSLMAGPRELSFGRKSNADPFVLLMRTRMQCTIRVQRNFVFTQNSVRARIYSIFRFAWLVYAQRRSQP